MTGMLTGWTFTRSIRNNAETHIKAALDQAVDDIPFPITGMDFDNGSELINHGVVKWAADRDIYLTRGRPHTKNDQATIESKNNHLVRHYAFYHRYDTDAEREVLNRLWVLVDAQANYLTPTKKPIGWGAPTRPASASACTTPPVSRWTGCWTPTY
ncbi:transposase family protein [Actinomyces trachealis]|uniref:transposase family protein n=1 Tax=Actinomyces trachealis TaxID=2763540 RepID=UPI001F384A42|nr:transposase family protein [Actinomyces trachealis]